MAIEYFIPTAVLSQCVWSGECIVWAGPIAGNDHPRMVVDGRRVLVRRHVMAANGIDISASNVVSTCGNHLCLRHLDLREFVKRPDDRKTSIHRDKSQYHRDSNLWKKYRIDCEAWEALFDAQGRVCAICGGTEPRGKYWHTDHRHSDGVIRGILCGCCNTAIGKLNEDPALFVKASNYLRQSTENH